MLVELERFTRHQFNDDEGEDDGNEHSVEVRGAPIAINPQHVAALFESTQDQGVCIIRLADGRGFIVKGAYAEIMEKLSRLPPQDGAELVA